MMKQAAKKLWRCIPTKIRHKLVEMGGGGAKLRFFLAVNKFVKRYKIENADLFETVELETINRCNGICPFCPVNANQNQRPFSKMERKLFDKIIEELSQINYTGSLALFSNNEPFLDERLIEMQQFVRKKLPNAYLTICTNGSLLTLEKYIAIIPYLDNMIIDNYNDEKIFNAPVKIIYEYCEKHVELFSKTYFNMRLLNEVLTTRGGQAPNAKRLKTIRSKCFYPYKQMIIRPDGKLSLCCNDALGKYTMGNANEHSLMEIWTSDYYKEIRSKMKTSGRKQLALCRYCDTKNFVRREL